MRKEGEVKSSLYLLASEPKGLHPFQRTTIKESNKCFLPQIGTCVVFSLLRCRSFSVINERTCTNCGGLRPPRQRPDY